MSSLRRRLLPKWVACHSEGGTTEESPVGRVKWEILRGACPERGILRYAQNDKRRAQDDNANQRDTSHGFTLVELVLSIAIIGVLLGLVGPMMIGSLRSYALVAHHKAALSQARLAMQRMTSEMLLIPDTDSITTWTPSALQFNIPSESNVSYSLSGGNLMRSGSVLASGVTSINFTYLDQNGAMAAAKADIKRIGVEMVVNAGTGYGSIKIRDQVFPRRFSSAYDGFQ